MGWVLIHHWSSSTKLNENSIASAVEFFDNILFG
ncbi:hypothetical protein HNR69_001479 [Histophilus somni]|nr:hypothetical protein [Histophilus somni]